MDINQQFRTAIAYILGPFFKITVSVVVIIVVILGIVMFINPKYNEAQQIGVLDLENKRNDLEIRKNELAQLNNLEIDYNKINQAQIKELEKILPTEVDFPGLVSQMEALAHESNLGLSSISVTEGGLWGGTGNEIPDAGGEVSKKSSSNIYLINVAVAFTGGGTYEHLKLFLDSIEKNMRILDLSSLSFAPETSGYTLNLKTYYIK